MSQPWKLKCAIDTAKAFVPFQRSLRKLKDRAIPYRREPNKDRNTIRDGLVLIEWLGNIEGSSVLEIGTGWQPMIPILFSLAGAKVYMADLHRLMRQDTFRSALDAIRENSDEIAGRLRITPDAIEHGTRVCHDMEKRLGELRIVYLAPCDCRHLRFDARSIDVVMSRAVLEHVPPAVINDIFKEGNRILRPEGRMLHLIDHSDHWSHRDRSITAVNFLRYSDWLFWLTCMNPQNYQNRLRCTDYRAMLEATGFAVKREQRNVDPASLAALLTMRTAKRFRQFSADDLATTSSILLAEPRLS